MLVRRAPRSSRSPRTWALVAATAAAWLFGAFSAGSGSTSCIATESYVYTAQKYDEANDCLAAYTSVETVNGSGANGTCRAACLTVGGALYVSTVCPPLPVIATPVEVDGGDRAIGALCRAALAAAARGGTCDAPVEGGADASDDGARDGSSDDGAADARDDGSADADASDGAIMDAADGG